MGHSQSTKQMHRANSPRLPNEAVKAILALMTRKQLIALSTLNHQFAHIIHSPSFATKPLLCIKQAAIIPAFCTTCRSWACGHKGTQVDMYMYDYFPHTPNYYGVDLDSILHPKWLRFKGKNASASRFPCQPSNLTPPSSSSFRDLHRAAAKERCRRGMAQVALLQLALPA